MSEPATSINTADVLAVDAAIARTTGAGAFGLTPEGFVPKPFARLLAEKLALARTLFGEDLDLTSGSAIRKILEISALEDARTWAALGTMYDNSFVSTATGDALSRLGEELGIPRPFMEARGVVTIRLTGTLPSGINQLTIRRGSRLLTAGGHHAATDETVVLSTASPVREVSVAAFYPGPTHNLDPTAPAPDGTFPQKIDRFNRDDPALSELVAAEAAAGAELVAVEHTQPLTGGERQWPDVRYRALLLQAPRSIWTVQAIQIAAALVPGVRQVQVHDQWGGLDLHQSIFGNFNFIERVFSSEREIANPYYFRVLVAPTPAAIWHGPNGLRASVLSAIEDLRPVGIFPQVDVADEVGVGVEAKLVVKGVPLPSGSRSVVNASAAAVALKNRLLVRLRRYIDELPFGEPVRAAEVVWTLMNEPGIADVRDLKLVRYPPGFDTLNFSASVPGSTVQRFECGQNVELQTDEIPVFVDTAAGLEII